MTDYQPAPPPAPAYTTPQAPTTYPGKGLGIAGLILAFLAPLIGLILSIVANSQSKKAGVKNGLAKAGIIVASVLLALSVVVAIIVGITLGGVVAKCAELGPGVWEENGVTYTCN